MFCNTGGAVGPILTARKGCDNNIVSLDLAQEIGIFVAFALFSGMIGMNFTQRIEDHARRRQFALNRANPCDRVLLVGKSGALLSSHDVV